MERHSERRDSVYSALVEMDQLLADAQRGPGDDSRRRRFFGAYLWFVAVSSLFTAAFMAHARDSWIIGDWLINYSGGFVRRGLPGFVALILHHATRVPLAGIIYAMQAFLFVVFLACVYRLTDGIRWSYLMMALLVSPATMAFTVLDPRDAGLRKELLIFAALAVTVVMLGSGKWKDWQISVAMSLFLVVSLLSHEGLVVAVPYFFAAVAIQTRSVWRGIRVCCVPFVLSVLVCGAVSVHHGNQATAQAICKADGGELGSGSPSVFHATGGFCGGAISWMQLNVHQERALISPYIKQWNQPRLYGLLAIPVFAPILGLVCLFYRRDGMHYEVLILLGCMMISLIGMAALFYVGMDWGRWIHIQAISLLLLLMMIDRLAATRSNRVPSARVHSRRVREFALVCLLLYATVWSLPGVGVFGEKFGYPGVWPQYRTYLGKIHRAL